MKHDFYYSLKHEIHMRELDNSMNIDFHQCFVNGIQYTEMIERGKTPHTISFDDLKLVYTGEGYENITVK